MDGKVRLLFLERLDFSQLNIVLVYTNDKICNYFCLKLHLKDISLMRDAVNRLDATLSQKV